jgi:hypothetical protein
MISHFGQFGGLGCLADYRKLLARCHYAPKLRLKVFDLNLGVAFDVDVNAKAAEMESISVEIQIALDTRTSVI